MAEYHVFPGVDAIYAGVLASKDMWKQKSDVTKEAMDAVAQYLYDSKQSMEFTIDGKRCRLEVRQI